MIRSLLACLMLFIFILSVQAFIIPKYTGPKECREMYWDLEHYGNHIAKQYDIELILVGNVTNSHPIFCLFMKSKKMVILKDGKIVMMNLLRDFYTHLLYSKRVNAYVSKEHPRENRNYLLPHNVAYKLTYWDNDINRPKPPYIAEILYVNGELYYYEADPITQKLRLVHQEPFNDPLLEESCSRQGISISY